MRAKYYFFILFGFLSSVVKSQDTYASFNYIPGSDILFSDDGIGETLNNPPSQWNLEGGKAVVKSGDNQNYISILEYYTILTPKLKSASYLPDNYTIEYDCWLDPGYDGNPGVQLAFRNGDEEVALLTPNKHVTNLQYTGGEKSEPTPSDLWGDQFYNKWIHVSVSVNKSNVHVFLNQYEALTIPDCHFTAKTIAIKGNTSTDMPIYFKNFVLATGLMNIDSDLNKGLFVTQAINFEVNKAVIKSSSMGIINRIVNYLKSNPAKQIEIGGHTDSDGDDAFNQILSQRRADAVKSALVAKGISESRITAVGYGESKPLNGNLTKEEKTLNRRVEFRVK